VKHESVPDLVYYVESKGFVGLLIWPGQPFFSQAHPGRLFAIPDKLSMARSVFIRPCPAQPTENRLGLALFQPALNTN